MPDIEVHIIESLSRDDVKQQRTEGAMLAQSLRLAGIRSVYSCVETRQQFASAISGIMNENARGGRVALHLSCHGDDSGIMLTEGETVIWYDLRAMLVPVNRFHAGQLLVCMSACRGLFGAGMALEPSDLPFYAIVGPATNVTFEDAAVGFVVFYHQLSKGTDIHRCVEIMKLASGEEQFGVVEGEPTRMAVLDAIDRIERGV